MLADLWQSLIVCDPAPRGPQGEALKVTQPCDFAALIHLIKNAITDLTVLATLITVFGCILIGFSLITSQGNAGAMKAARGRAVNILKGYFFILAAWVIVYAISSVLFQDSYFNTVLTNTPH